MAEETAQERYPKRVRKPAVREFSSNASWPNQKRWTQNEKELLHSALKKYGDHDVALLAAKIKSKTPAAVYSYLLSHKQASAEASRSIKTERLERLRKWVEHIRTKKQQNPSPNPAALSMLMIALVEDHPVPTDGEVNFNEAYNYMFELFSQRHHVRWQEDRTLSTSTLQFIKLTTLKLLKTSTEQLDSFQIKLAESGNSTELFTEENLNHLPAPIRRLVLHKHLNPLRLNEQSTQSDLKPCALEVDHVDSLNPKTVDEQLTDSAHLGQAPVFENLVPVNSETVVPILQRDES